MSQIPTMLLNEAPLTMDSAASCALGLKTMCPKPYHPSFEGQQKVQGPPWQLHLESRGAWVQHA